MMNFANEYMGVLQNMEFAIVSVYRKHSDLADSAIDAALEGLERTYVAEQRGRNAPKLRLSELSHAIFDGVKAVCEWQLGRGEMPEKAQVLSDEDEGGLDVDEVIACLKHIRSSINFWTKERGRQGYIHYVQNFFPTGQSD